MVKLTLLPCRLTNPGSTESITHRSTIFPSFLFLFLFLFPFPVILYGVKGDMSKAVEEVMNRLDEQGAPTDGDADETCRFDEISTA